MFPNLIILFLCLLVTCAVGRSRRIDQLLLCRVRPLPNECPVYDIKPSDSEAPALEILGMWSDHGLPLLPGPFWPGVVAPDRVLSMGQIEPTVCANKWLMLNYDCYIAILETIKLYVKKELRLI